MAEKLNPIYSNFGLISNLHY